MEYVVVSMLPGEDGEVKPFVFGPFPDYNAAVLAIPFCSPPTDCEVFVAPLHRMEFVKLAA